MDLMERIVVFVVVVAVCTKSTIIKLMNSILE